MLGIPIIEWIGYIGSLLIALSITMSSIVKLRWINLIGATIFSTYGFIIDALPVALLNGFIAGVNIYFLIKLANKNEAFKLLPVEPNNKIIKEFLDFYKKDIAKLAPDFDFSANPSEYSFLILRNMDIAGVFIGKEENNQVLEVILDYVSPKYRDFKLGDFVYRNDSKIFRGKSFKQVIGRAKTKAYRTYFKRMGFKKQKEKAEEVTYVMEFKA